MDEYRQGRGGSADASRTGQDAEVGRSGIGAAQRLVTPPIDIFEDADGLSLVADLPGVSRQTAEIQMEESRLTLFGKLDFELPEDAVSVHEEFAVANFFRSFILSENIDHEQIDAELADGVLTVRLPRATRPAPRRIQIGTPDDATS